MPFDVKQNPGSTVISFSGPIDEDFMYTDVNVGSSSVYKFDFKETTLINSCGIKELLNLIRSLEDVATISYLRCPPFLVQQISMVKGFLGPRKKVESLFIPYFDEEKGKDYLVLTEVSSISKTNLPLLYKDFLTKKDIPFDGSPAKFFRFLELQG